jgi:hypothetical protein
MRVVRKEPRLADLASERKLSAAKARAEASFKKEERARDGSEAMAEYVAQGRHAREQMAKLRELRLAKEAAERAAATGAGKATKR